MQAKLGLVATAAPLSGALDRLARQHVPKGSRKYSSGVAAPTTLTLSHLWPAALYITHSFSRLEASRKGPCGGSLSSASPGCRITKAGSVFAALTPAVFCHSKALSQMRPNLLSKPLPSSRLSLRSILLGSCFFFCGFSSPENSMGLVNL